MGELTLWQKITALLWKPWVWLQCQALDGCEGDVSRYACCRRRGHFGPHKDVFGNGFR